MSEVNETSSEPTQEPTPETKTLVSPEPTSESPTPLTSESIKLPEGFEAGDTLPKFVDVFNNSELASDAKAQALIDLHVDLMKQASEKGSQLWATTQENWAKEAKEDPVIGGEKLEPTLGNISKMIDAYAKGPDGKPDPVFARELREVMDVTGAGNNPRVIRFLNNLALDLVKEGGPVPAGIPAVGDRSAAQVLYPNQGT